MVEQHWRCRILWVRESMLLTLTVMGVLCLMVRLRI